MPGASTKRARSDDDQLLSPDESAPSPPKRTQTRKSKTLESRKSEKNYHSDNDDETSSDEPTSSSGSSIDSSGDDSDDEEDEQETRDQEEREDNGAIPSIAARQKPRIHRIEKDNGIMSRLTAFLPQMKNANEHLERELAAGRGKELQVDGVDEEGEGRYIEMNLGLGVLEEKRSDDESSDDEDESPDNEEGKQLPTELPSRPKDPSVLGKLMGVEKDESKKPTIEEMNE